MSLDKLKTILRTVCDPVADCPQFTFANPPNQRRLWTNFRTLRRTVRYAAADCPQLNLADLPELLTALDNIKLYRGLSAIR